MSKFLLLILPVLTIIGLLRHSHPDGAISLGLVTIGLDFYWQLFRFNLIRRAGTGILGLSVFGGLLIRVLSIFILFNIARSRFESPEFQIFMITILTLPIWNVVEAFILGKEN